MSSRNQTSPSDILKSHLTQLLDAITVPDRLANDLSVADLIAGPVKNRVLEVPIYDNYKKASILVNEVHTSLKVFNDPETLVKFCHVLKAQDHPNLDRIADAMLRELGIDAVEVVELLAKPLVRKQSVPINPDSLRKCHSDICDILNTSDDTLQIFAQKLFSENVISNDTKISVTRTGGRKGADSLLDHIQLKVEHDHDCFQLVLEVMEKDEYLCHIVEKMKGENKRQEIVLGDTSEEPAPKKKPVDEQKVTSHVIQCIVFVMEEKKSDLSRLFDRDMEAVAEKMLETGIITQTIGRNPTSDAIINSFLSAFDFMDELEDIDKHFVKFLSVFYKIGGPFVAAGDMIKKRLQKKTKDELGIELKLNGL